MKDLDKIYNQSSELKIDDNSKLVIMSDCHRGNGNKEDNFLKNKDIYKRALYYYYNKDYTYIELGDGDDMWEVKKFEQIIDKHLDVFKLLKKFHHQKRLIMVYGNHDLCKKHPKILHKYFYHYENKNTKQREELLNKLQVKEALILSYEDKKIFLIHGHQADFLNYKLWKLARFLVRNVWHYLEIIGIKDPTSAAKNYKVKQSVEKKLANWSKEHNIILIAGHTHRPIYPESGESMYFNDGSCIHPNGITCLEIQNGSITLVNWINDDDNKDSIIKRVLIEKPEKLNNFYK